MKYKRAVREFVLGGAIASAAGIAIFVIWLAMGGELGSFISSMMGK